MHMCTCLHHGQTHTDVHTCTYTYKPTHGHTCTLAPYHYLLKRTFAKSVWTSTGEGPQGATHKACEAPGLDFGGTFIPHILSGGEGSSYVTPLLREDGVTWLIGNLGRINFLPNVIGTDPPCFPLGSHHVSGCELGGGLGRGRAGVRGCRGLGCCDRSSVSEISFAHRRKAHLQYQIHEGDGVACPCRLSCFAPQRAHQSDREEGCYLSGPLKDPNRA